jgi:hypothetical protein
MWSTFLDIDEFVVLRNHSSIGEFLRDVAPEGGAVVLNWSVFGCNGTVKQSHEPVLVRFVQSAAFTNAYVKTTAYLPHVRKPSIHNMILHHGYPCEPTPVKNPETSYPDPLYDIGFNNFYFQKPAL